MAEVTRGDFLKVLGILTAGASAASSCSPLAKYIPGQGKNIPDPPGVNSLDWLILNRLSFGPRPEDRQRLLEIGFENYLEEQLSPDTIADRKTNLLTSRFEILDMDADGLRNRADQILGGFDPSRVLDDFRQATLLRQVYSQRQLYEVMVEFWTDHFNISVQKGDCWFLKVVDDREVIRKFALGDFRELLGASAHSPAMLVYLDNQENHKDAPNENYARELLELHSLGVNGGYSQNDVMELARCLTGWRVKEHFWKGQLDFEPDAHSPGRKTVLGTTVYHSGEKEIDQVLDMLVEHPSTARTISMKLAQRFLADDPPPEIVEKATQAFLDTSGNIKSVLRVILLDGLPIIHRKSQTKKYKRPLNYMVSALRQLGADTNAGPDLNRYLVRMGQPLYDWPTPDGFPDTAEAWQGNLLPRWQFALELSQNTIDGTEFNIDNYLQDTSGNDPGFFLERISNNLLGKSLSPSDEIEIINALQNQIKNNPHQTAQIVIAGIIASPAFQWR
jgi:uncharacterized protein (DUF1800 family)